MPKAVFDSTVLISAFLSEAGLSRELLRQARAGLFTVCVSEEILEETERVLLEYPRIRKRYCYSDEAVAEYIMLLRVLAQVVTEIPNIKNIVRDPNDDMVIACALKAKAHYIITRDKYLLTLEANVETSIFSPEEFIKLLRE